MSRDSREKKDGFISISPMLNLKPQLGPIPGEMVIPWALSGIISYLLCQGLMGLGWTPTCLVAVWGMGVSWLLMGSQGARYLHKFERIPRITRGQSLYQPLLNQDTDHLSGETTDSSRKRRSPESSRKKKHKR